jgi:hypothetical protein
MGSEACLGHGRFEAGISRTEDLMGSKPYYHKSEDRAYSLLGLFGGHMAMLYGEGENAFLRLQDVIPRTTSEDSIFSWKPEIFRRIYLLWFTRKISRRVPALWWCSSRGAHRHSNLKP